MKGLKPGDVPVLQCPECHGSLTWQGTERSGFLHEGELRSGCGQRWRVEDGRPWLYSREDLQGIDVFMKFLYDFGGWAHDAGVAAMFPLWEKEGSEHRFRETITSWLDLESLEPHDDGTPLRFLEVSVGSGANMRYVLDHLPDGLPVEMWALDYSEAMMDLCRRTLKKGKLKAPDDSHFRLLMADAHRLPFETGSFDRVLHIGAITAFNDPHAALREMIRVARPDTPIVVVDEALDHTRRHAFETRMAWRNIVPHVRNPQPPREALPAHAEILVDDPLSRMYYIWAFKVPEPPPAPSA